MLEFRKLMPCEFVGCILLGSIGPKIHKRFRNSQWVYKLGNQSNPEILPEVLFLKVWKMYSILPFFFFFLYIAFYYSELLFITVSFMGYEFILNLLFGFKICGLYLRFALKSLSCFVFWKVFDFPYVDTKDSPDFSH